MSICSRRFRFTFGKPCARASAMNGDPKTDYVKSEIATNDDVINTEDVKLIIDEAKLFLDDVKTVIDELELGIDNVKFDTEIVTDDAQLVIDDGQTDNESLEVHSDDEMGTDKGVFCCVKRCESMFNNGFKSLLKSSVSKLSWSEKRIFLFTMVTVNKTKTHRNIKCPKQHLCFRYVVKEFGVERPVCKKAFVRLHGVTLSMVNSVLDNVYEILPLDGRGKHNNHHTIPKELQELIRIHLFKVIDSHAVSKFATGPLSQLSLQKLWCDFVQKHGTISKFAYVKYVKSFLTPEDLTKFMSTQQAHKIYAKSVKFLKK